MEQRLDLYQQALANVEESQQSASRQNEEVRKISSWVSQVRTEVEVSKSQLLDVRASLAKMKASRLELIDIAAAQSEATEQKFVEIENSVARLSKATSENLNQRLSALHEKLNRDFGQLRNSLDRKELEKETSNQQLLDKLASPPGTFRAVFVTDRSTCYSGRPLCGHIRDSRKTGTLGC